MDQPSQFPAGPELRRRILEKIDLAKLKLAKHCTSPRQASEFTRSLYGDFLGRKPVLVSLEDGERILSEIISLIEGISLTILTNDEARLAALVQRVEDSGPLSYVVCSHAVLPNSESDPIVAKVRHHAPDVVLIDIDPENPHSGIEAILLVKGVVDDVSIFAVGPMTNPPTIVAAMRGGAVEYLDRESGTEELLEALRRFSSQRKKDPGPEPEDNSGSTPPGGSFPPPSGGTPPPMAPVGAPRSRPPKTLPSRKAASGE